MCKKRSRCGDPVATFSDWKIVVSVKDQDTPKQTYHVHRVLFAHGKRYSSYFRRLFQNADKFQEGQANTSHIVLDELAAEPMPQFLDFIYTDQPLGVP